MVLSSLFGLSCFGITINLSYSWLSVSVAGNERLDDSLDLIRSLAMALLCLNLNDSLPVSMIWQWWNTDEKNHTKHVRHPQQSQIDLFRLFDCLAANPPYGRNTNFILMPLTRHGIKCQVFLQWLRLCLAMTRDRSKRGGHQWNIRLLESENTYNTVKC